MLLAPRWDRLCLSAFLLPCGSGTSRWLRYGLFSSLSENDPGGVMPPKAVTYSRLLIGTWPAQYARGFKVMWMPA